MNLTLALDNIWFIQVVDRQETSERETARNKSNCSNGTMIKFVEGKLL